MNPLKTEIRTLIKYEFDYGHTPMQAWRNIIDAKGLGVVSHLAMKRWFSKFKNGQEGTSD